jgi:hypothetical protein
MVQNNWRNFIKLVIICYVIFYEILPGARGRHGYQKYCRYTWLGIGIN